LPRQIRRRTQSVSRTGFRKKGGAIQHILNGTGARPFLTLRASINVALSASKDSIASASFFATASKISCSGGTLAPERRLLFVLLLRTCVALSS
jgi:hypothetical protein